MHQPRTGPPPSRSTQPTPLPTPPSHDVPPRRTVCNHPECTFLGPRKEQEEAKEKPLRMQVPQKPSTQRIAASYGYHEKEFGMMLGEILYHDGTIHLAFRVRQKGARFLMHIVWDDAEVKPYYLGRRMHSGNDMLRTLEVEEERSRQASEGARIQDTNASKLATAVTQIKRNRTHPPEVLTTDMEGAGNSGKVSGDDDSVMLCTPSTATAAGSGSSSAGDTWHVPL